jgi:hypothetical protein
MILFTPLLLVLSRFAYANLVQLNKGLEDAFFRHTDNSSQAKRQNGEIQLHREAFRLHVRNLRKRGVTMTVHSPKPFAPAAANTGSSNFISSFYSSTVSWFWVKKRDPNGRFRGGCIC